MTEAFRTASGAGRPPPIPPAATSHGTAQDAGESKAGEFKAGEFKAGQVTGRGSGIQRSLVGAPLEEVRTRLIAIAARLEPHLEPQAMPIVVQARRVLADQTCRIAVIGQIKAGKSSFINVFTQRPDLLPTDINPWTAVVTSLHMRNDRVPPHAAVFRMFSREEWQRLAEGGGRLRELTERLVPGFEPELLRAQIQAMRQRVEHRLGPRLNEVLGQTHSFDKITPELLDDYVSAGTYLAPGGAAPAGRPQYADVTRTADLHLGGGPFAFPVTLIDTPGTNDPFLVRDEITRRSLENVDISVFVISALQPLSASDIAMLRILNGLHKDRIIVFINRVDQLRDPATDGKAVLASVKSRIDREFAALDIPVVAGSAWWGGLGLMAAERDVSRLLPAASIAYLRDCGLAPDIQIAADKPLPPEQRPQLAAALFAASGMPAIANGINTLLTTGSSAVLLRQLAGCFLELARTTEVSAKLELQSALGLIETRRAESLAIGDRIRQERVALGELDEPIRQIQHSFALIERQLGEILHSDTVDMRADLEAIVERFASAEAGQMMHAIRRREHDGEWRTDLRPLREDLETHFVEAYRATESRLIEIERVLYPQLKTIVDAIVPGSGIDIADNYALPSNPYPALAPLAETAVLDLDLPWWKHWFAARPDPALRASDLKRIIRGDFLPVAEQMVSQAHRELSARIARTLQQAHAVSTGMLTAIQSRKSQVLAEYEALHNPQGGFTGERLDAEQREMIGRCQGRHTAAVQLVNELAKVSAFCQHVLEAEGRS